ncbi:MAG: 5-keto-4-deoxy-D-glucarate aldolase [Anaerolineales bacterium]|nr:5-keto-4-deoxy-D-glucarate aldolase [Anaerolineales bacterium]
MSHSDNNRLRSIWQAGGTVFNSMLKIPSAFAAEIMANQGWDSLTIDLQHGPVSDRDVFGMLQAIFTTSTVPLVRIPWNEPSIIMRMLDAGCYGVIGPMINTRAEAEAFVGACRYPPEGYRSYGPYRTGLEAGPDYSDRGSDTPIAIAMIETAAALHNLDAILSVPGLDAIFIGPNDLARSLKAQQHGGSSELDVTDAIDEIIAAAQRHDIVAGIYTPTPEDAVRMMEQGCQFIALSADAYLLASAAGQVLKRVRANTG